MAGETLKTLGIPLSIRPWSRTSHVVTWLTLTGVVTTLVKGALRPKSAFLGQYDLFYTCELVYYARSNSGMHAIREASPVSNREYLRSSWRAISLAGYAADTIRDLTPHGNEAKKWFDFFAGFLDGLADCGNEMAQLVRLDMDILKLAGLEPDFSEMDYAAEWTPFSIECGRCSGEGRTIRLAPQTVRALKNPQEAAKADLAAANRFLAVFVQYHIDRPVDVRRSLVGLLG
jgi:DNA repair protein RecO